jgi:hypothetical protein
MGSCSKSWDCLAWPKFANLSLHCWLHVIMYIPAWTSASIIIWRGRSPGRAPVTAVGAVLVDPVTARQANICNLLSYVLRPRHLTKRYIILMYSNNFLKMKFPYLHKLDPLRLTMKKVGPGPISVAIWKKEFVFLLMVLSRSRQYQIKLTDQIRLIWTRWALVSWFGSFSTKLFKN